MKTLIVSYIPRNEQSNTKKLLDAFREEIGISDVEELDLLVDVPDMFLDSNLSAYINRNFLGQKLILYSLFTLTVFYTCTIKIGQILQKVC